jgi:[acyl-carrier-protein] S-malonyltransferase
MKGEMDQSAVFLFPGQGAQVVGMGKSLFESSERARRLFARGSEALGEDLIRLCLHGPQEALDSTRVSQPAIFLLSLAALDALAERLGSPAPLGRGLPAAATAGLSLGEYTALVFAGSLELEDALRVVVHRGRWMQEACDAAPGGMVSLMGLGVAQVEDAVAKARVVGRIGIANYNSPDQTVISGEERALEAAVTEAKRLGCRRATPLRVAGAYHSPLMSSATQRLRPLLEQLSIRPPRCPFFSNLTGAAVTDPEAIRQGLIAQVESSVRWTSIMDKILQAGHRRALEIGPGKVLKGLFRNVDREFAVDCLCEVDSLAEFQEQRGSVASA